MIYIGIDPGKRGAMVIFPNNDPSTPIVHVAPIRGKEYDLKEMFRMVPSAECFDRRAVKSMFSIGYGYAAWEMALVGNGIPYLSVRPREWQKEMFKDISPVMSGTLTKAGNPKVDTKAMGLLLDQQLFPVFN